MDTEQLKKELAPQFVKYRDDIVAAYLFGSTARGATSPSSDIDIAGWRAPKTKQAGLL